MQQDGDKVLEANVAFTARLYRILSKKPGNVLFSPFSIHCMLCILREGARGDTASALAEILDSTTENAVGYKAILQELDAWKYARVITANGVYVKKCGGLEEEFRSVVNDRYFSDVVSLDFGHEDAVHVINERVKEKTGGKIKKLLEVLDADASLVLISAIFFKGSWLCKFRKEETIDDFFYINRQEKVGVKMMRSGERSLSYKKDAALDAEVVFVQIGGNDAAMVLVLPSESSTIEELEQKMLSRPLQDVFEDLEKVQVILHLPKFKIERSLDLKEELFQMGSGIIFERSKADFTGISREGGLHVGEVIHETCIEVNEEGCEAAAITAIPIVRKYCAWNRLEPVLFEVNRPCVFMLVALHGKSPNILFCGRLSNPNNK